MKKIWRWTIRIGVVVALVGIRLGLDQYRFAYRPAGTDTTQILVEIAPGEAFDSLAERLKAAHVLTDVRRFKLLARLEGLDTRLRAGEYALTGAMTPKQVLEALVSGKVFLRRLTIPEGYTLKQIAAELTAAGITDPVQFTALTADPQTIRGLGLTGQSLEGYLFPDTYYFPKGTTPLTLINQMVGRFAEQFSTQWRERAQALGWSLHQVVTLASIVEKETGDPSERPLVASVFHNRLQRKMRLESDPTVIYGIQDFDGNLTREHLTAPNAYNTYVIDGLPPGPIANPGRAALEATLYPAQTPFLFFVSKNDRTHHFSATLQEHTRAVRKYQQRPQKQSPHQER